METQIRRIREEKGISIGQLAEKTGIKKNTLVNMDCGNTLISVDNAIKLTKALGTQIYKTTKR